MTGQLSLAQARRIALRAQLLDRPPPAAPVTAARVRSVLRALGAVQLDAVNVLVRSHYLTLYSRLGASAPELLDDVVYRRRHGFEYWGHAMSFVPVELHPALRWRMRRRAEQPSWRRFRDRVERERPGYLDALAAEVGARGPLAYADLADKAPRDRSARAGYADSTLLWYRWSDGKSALEGLFDAGELAAAGRRGFERLYDVPSRVLPSAVLAAPGLSLADGQRELVRRAMAALGVATARDVADYFRLPGVETRARLRELVSSGELAPARVEGWADPAWLAPGPIPRAVDGRALLSPFDSLLWERGRVRRLFGFRHSFELYVKPDKREFGYFVLPFLLGDALVARVDVKADRPRGALLVPGAFLEPAASEDEVVPALAEELSRLAGWLGLSAVEVGSRGSLAGPLRRRF
ncbi:winged helix-turn-helix domain-containing protein [Jiangella anatolica]|uniref:Cytoplasmic protein n=1 Tax=Jiangella anatolica TaxID=2670374 RepID=A0A2W2C345_9ACTN|nr:crosslink repair DNA glycosylase YcaQ family protein [Jiangella anatolica]PZF82619.1 cytoplasmic protein [Jiangella anatolica]